MKAHQGQDYLNASKKIASLLHARDNIEAAKDAILEAMNKYPTSVKSEDTNLVLELLIQLGGFDDALDVFCRFCAVQFDADRSAEAVADLEPERQLKEAFTAVKHPDDLVLDLRGKLAVVLIRLGAKHLVSGLVEDVLKEDAETYGDVMLDLAEAFMATQNHEEAIPLLEKLINSETYCQVSNLKTFFLFLC